MTDEFLKLKADNVAWVEETRKRLSSLGWFMKCLKEPLARMANKQDGCRGTFFEERFKSIAILEEESLLSVCTYIDLNPMSAGIVELPEESGTCTAIKNPGLRLELGGPLCPATEYDRV